MKYLVEVTTKNNELFVVRVEAIDAKDAVKKAKKSAFYLHDVGPDDRKLINVYMDV